MKTIALVDANNFFASCERVFNPRLWHQPVIVLSNGDGCVIARSNEAKALGIHMGQPLFQIKDMIRQKKVHVFSSNFELYGDMSRRIMKILSRYTHSLEIYSIDEAFLDLSFQKSLTALGRDIRQTIQQGLGIPLSIGIGSSKALAKIANYLVKKNLNYEGVLDLTQFSNIDFFLKQVPIGDVWGIGRRLGPAFKRQGILTAYDLKETRLSCVRDHMGIGGVKLVSELRGESCFKFEETPAQKKMLTVSRTFGASTQEYECIKEAVAHFTVRIAEKLRGYKLVAGSVGVSIRTNRFNNDPKHYDFSFILLEEPTALTPCLLKASLSLLKKIYKPGFKYNKASVSLFNLSDQDAFQKSLFKQNETSFTKPLMQAIDHVNQRYSRETLIYGAQGLSKRWQPIPGYKSPRYSTRWTEIPLVKTG